MDRLKKISILIVFLFYSTLFYHLHEKFIWYSYFFIIYPSIRLILDFFLILFSLFNNQKVVLFIAKITQGKIHQNTSWNQRLLGVLKWLAIHFIVCTLCIILFRGYLHL
jgi:hypothetical protein